MLLTREILNYLLLEKLHLTGQNLNNPSETIKKILLFREEVKEPGTLLLASGQTEENENTLCISSQPHPGWHVIVPEEQVDATISRILSICQDFWSWTHSCSMLALAEHDLPGTLEAACRYLNLEWTIIDREYQNIASYPSYSFMGQKDIPGCRMMPLDAMDSLYFLNPEYDKTYDTTGLCAYPFFQMEHAELYYCNMFHETMYVGRQLIGLPKGKCCDGLLRLVYWLCDLTLECFHERYRSMEREETRSILTLTRRLFAGEVLPEEERQYLLEQMKWGREDRLVVVRLVSNGYDRTDGTLHYYAIQMERWISGCLALAQNGGINCICNLEQIGEELFRQKLSHFLRESLFKAGVSNDFASLEKSAYYLRQAEDALRLGAKYTPSLWRCEFSSYVIQYITEQCLKDYEPMELCPENLRMLIRYDQEHLDSFLTETLYQYYASNFSVQEASAKLFIHRTTFFYRMNKIKKLVQLHPEDPGEVAVILLVLSEMKKQMR